MSTLAAAAALYRILLPFPHRQEGTPDSHHPRSRCVPASALASTLLRIALLRMADETINGLPVTNEMIEGVVAGPR